ncbi:5-nitrosalicylic acid 1,2-dioxygenase [compost metagenome]
MNSVQGAFFSYNDFRQSLVKQPDKPRVWKDVELTAMRKSLEASDVDIVALAHDGSLDGCSLTPGMAVSMQWLIPGAELIGHVHAWWHLFIIQSGNGTLTLGDAEAVGVGSGDVLLVPAWTRHGFVNTSATEPLAMLNISNMPQALLLANHNDNVGLIPRSI